MSLQLTFSITPNVKATGVKLHGCSGLYVLRLGIIGNGYVYHSYILIIQALGWALFLWVAYPLPRWAKILARMRYF